ncbi:PQQ-dependent sugar dehydrogenase [Methylobacterium gregans]|uniref:PQQ-dependent sugar dehydrogenase n=1 Tax=Methylobacterium gregans TaxID=374424 RepID=UPI0024B582D1|nr:PQQ-dependent sugar dehydrogenase [Methylobacterium gregans]
MPPQSPRSRSSRRDRRAHLARRVMVDGKATGKERLLLSDDQHVRDVKQAPDGALWALTDDADGRLIRMAPGG